MIFKKVNIHETLKCPPGFIKFFHLHVDYSEQVGTLFSYCFLHTTGVISISHAIHLRTQQGSPPQFFCPYLITSYLYQSVGLDINLCGIIIIILREPLFTLMSVTFNIYSMSMYVLGIGC